MDLARQKRLFAYALVKLVQLKDLVNRVLEVFENENGKISFEVYEVPAPQP